MNEFLITSTANLGLDDEINDNDQNFPVLTLSGTANNVSFSENETYSVADQFEFAVMITGKQGLFCGEIIDQMRKDEKTILDESFWNFNDVTLYIKSNQHSNGRGYQVIQKPEKSSFEIYDSFSQKQYGIEPTDDQLMKGVALLRGTLNTLMDQALEESNKKAEKIGAIKRKKTLNVTSLSETLDLDKVMKNDSDMLATFSLTSNWQDILVKCPAFIVALFLIRNQKGKSIDGSFVPVAPIEDENLKYIED